VTNDNLTIYISTVSASPASFPPPVHFPKIPYRYSIQIYDGAKHSAR